MSKRVAVTTIGSDSISLGEGVGDGSWPKQTLGAKMRSEANRIALRIRLGCWRARLAIANFSCATSRREILVLGQDCFGATPKPTRETRALPEKQDQTGRFFITSYLQLNSESWTC